MANTFYWNSEKTPESINRALKTLSVRYPQLKGCCGDYAAAAISKADFYFADVSFFALNIPAYAMIAF